jgi:hypothetical protein
MDEKQLEQKLDTDWVEKRQEFSFICPVCGAAIQTSDIALHKEWHLRIKQ